MQCVPGYSHFWMVMLTNYYSKSILFVQMRTRLFKSTFPGEEMSSNVLQNKSIILIYFVNITYRNPGGVV